MTRAEDTAPAPRALRTDTKQARLVEMLHRPDGATLDEMTDATGWQRHTVRGAISGALKKRLGITVTSEIDAARGRVYRATTCEDGAER